MIATKVRCKQCYSKNKKGNEEPCNICAEINVKTKGFENHFIPENKDLLRDLNDNK